MPSEKLPPAARVDRPALAHDMAASLGYYEFFAGAGLVRLGLEPHWRSLWANDIDPKKASVYSRNFGSRELVVKDVALVQPEELPGQADMAWASFPCQDLSLAGTKLGMDGTRSRTFWHFLRVIRGLAAQGRQPPILVVENVPTLLHEKNLIPVLDGLASLGLLVSAFVIDAIHFLPQSRARAFIVAAPERAIQAAGLSLAGPDLSTPWFTPQVLRAFERLPEALRSRWVWLRLPPPPPESIRPTLLSLLETSPEATPWHSEEETSRLLSMMSTANRAKVDQAMQMSQRTGRPIIGTLYRRMRQGQQRAELRIDGVAGSLRASQGGSSKLFIMVFDGSSVRSRRLSAREAARLMGVPDSYWLPPRYGEAYSAVADGVAVPVTAWLSTWLLRPLALAARGAVSTEQSRRVYERS